MKFLASLLIVCIVFLSAFSGPVKPLQVTEKADCCANSENMAHCPKNNNRKHHDSDCEKQGCNVFLTCSICGFLAVEPLVINTTVAVFIENPAPTYKTGNLAVYLPSDWKPPKI